MSDEIIEITVPELYHMLFSNTEQKAIDLASFDNSNFDMDLFANALTKTFDDLALFGITKKQNGQT